MLEPEGTEWPPNVFKPVPTDITTHERVGEGTSGAGTSVLEQEPAAAGTSQQGSKPRRGRPPKQGRDITFAPEVLAALQAMVTNAPATTTNAPTVVTIFPTTTVCERRMWTMVNVVWQRPPQ